MKVLIWVTPWVGQNNDLFFFRNAFNKHLLKQANTLCSKGIDVSVILPSSLLPLRGNCNPKIKVIEISSQEAISLVGGWKDPSKELHLEPFGAMQAKISAWLDNILSEKFDVVLSWETPVPFLQSLYPGALIIHQMPGGFARPPFPHTVTFDPIGLYSNGIIGRYSTKIFKDSWGTYKLAKSIGPHFKSLFSEFKYQKRDTLLERASSDHLTLLPLQVSSHYAFRAETDFQSQLDYLHTVSNQLDGAIYVTEYVSKLYSEICLSEPHLAFFQKSNPQILFDSGSRELPSVSQFLLPEVDRLAVATSGLAIQTLIWDTEVIPYGRTQFSDWAGIKTSEEKEKMLEFILNRHQPLASKVVEDGDFLVNLIEELKGRQKNLTPDNLPDFTSIDPSYEEKLFLGTRRDIVKSDFKAAGIKSACEREDQLAELLKSDISLVCFDIFDTLVERPFEAPADLYGYLELEASKAGFQVFDFAQKRLQAELNARENASKEEITLDEIYLEFQKLDKAIELYADELKALEKDVEVRVSKQRALGKRLWNLVQSKGFQVVLASDMYLDRSTIERILNKNGYAAYEELFLSSEVGATKKTGRLFDYLSKQTRIKPKKIVHIGDNLKTDVKPAESLGFNVFHVPRAETHFWENSNYKSVFGKRNPIEPLQRSLVAANIARTRFAKRNSGRCTSLFNNDPSMLGYCSVGPIVFGMADWLRRKAENDRVTELHFLSREGRILFDAFQIMQRGNEEKLRAKYLYGSRRVIRVATLRNISDIYNLAMSTIDASASFQSLLEQRFGVSPSSDIMAKSKDAGIRKLSDLVSGYDKSVLFRFLSYCSDEILKNALGERETYLAYLNQVGFGSSDRPYVVDVGWNANMQGSLAQLTGKKVGGYYFATLERASRWVKRGYPIQAYYRYGDMRPEKDGILSNRLLLEHFLCDIGGTVVSIAKNREGIIEPILGDCDCERDRFVKDVHKGALSFVKDMVNTLEELDLDIEFEPELMCAIMGRYMANPTATDAELVKGHQLEDAFSGAGRLYVINARDRIGVNVAKSYWKPGAKKLENKHARSPEQSEAPSVWAKAVLKLAEPFVVPRLEQHQAFLYRSNPSELFENAKHPKLVKLGKVAGFI
ncbi:HAD-IA family hydrolase [Pseudovibrio sp. SPO723]|uniref:HAD-IA family hydrolase n=1 Tax=Nesiotobacter zosterae TaxID=392721 RepID=UPI0029C3009A|nr:HAD-IA family hydrolase [Pseudovibrio sp. SPO723]MDX5594265.1 HAD-IA family hydrolase [Pseudovibrio sp. SPO723]